MRIRFLKVIYQFIPPIIWNMTAKLKLKESEKKYFGLNQIDKKIENYLNYDNGFYVELGANDGIQQSNTFFFEKYRGWKGVLIEPIGQKYTECLKNRSKDNKIFCNACVSFEYKEKFVELTYSNLMTTSSDLESDLINPVEHAKRGLKYIPTKEYNYNFGSLAATLNSILVNSDAPQKMDFLSLDVEGAEVEVLKGLNHKQFRFKYLCIESRNLNKLTKYLSENDYVFVEKLSIHDYLFRDVNES